MIRVIVVVALASFIGQAAATKSRVDYSGVWQLEDPSAEALDIGGMTGGGNFMTIRQDAEQIAIDRMYARAALKFVVRLDGRDSVNIDQLHMPSASVDLISHVTWAGSSLIIETDRIHTDRNGKVTRQKTRETLSLDAGKLVIVRTETLAARAPVTSKRIYVRKPAGVLKEGPGV